MENTKQDEPAAAATTSTVAADASADPRTTNLDELQKRLQSLKMMQREYVCVEKDFHRQFYELDMEYQKKRQAVYNQRKAIINGTGDCSKQTPDEIDIDEDIKGIPGFWLRALKNCTNLIRDCDDEPFNYLNDIKLNLMCVPELSFILEFEFAANPFFENATLTKQYFLDCDTADEFNGFSIVKTIGCQIQWKHGMNITEKDATSFFMFFNPPDIYVPTQSNETQQSEIFDELQHDFEIGLMIKEKLIPNAILYYLDEFEEVIDCSTLDETTMETTKL